MSYSMPNNTRMFTSIVDEEPSFSSFLGDASFSSATEEDWLPDHVQNHTSPLSSALVKGERRWAKVVSQEILNFERLGLYGREKEIESLKRILEESKSNKSQCTFLSGKAGSGKTSLAKELSKLTRGFYVEGKFDQQHHDEPYGGFAIACRELCAEILRRGYGQDVKKKIEEELGSDASELIAIVPGMSQLFGSEALERNETHLSDLKERLTHTFRTFLRVVGSFAPLALILDDLQWADVSTLQLVKSLLEDSKLSLMIVGTYRSEDLDANNALSNIIVSFRESQDNEAFRFTEIIVTDLTIEVVEEFVSGLFSMDSECHELAGCIHRKTLGNAFFTVQFIAMLVDQKMVKYHIGSHKWSFDLLSIQRNTKATDNVVDLMKERLCELPSTLHELMPAMASLGSEFSWELFLTMMDHMDDIGVDACANLNQSEQAAEILNDCEKLGVIERRRDCSYRWIHDKIQEAALALLPEDRLLSLQFRLGHVLYKALEDTQHWEPNLFMLVSLLNRGICTMPPGDPMRTTLAAMNLKVGIKSKNIGAFGQASEFLEIGMSLLNEDCWSSQPELALALFSEASEALYCAGHLEETRPICDVILAQDMPLLDKQRAYDVSIYSTASRSKLKEAELLCIDVLSKLGCAFPKRMRSLHVIAGLFRLKSQCSHILNAFPTLALMSDPKHRWTMSLLDQLANYSYQVDPDIVPLVSFRGIQLTLSYGLCEYSAPNLALLGFLFIAAMNDFAGGKAIADLVLSVLQKTRARSVESRTLLLIAGLVYHWAQPVERCRKLLLRGYKSGMASGDVESAGLSIMLYLEQLYYAGGSLRTIEGDCTVYAEQLQDLGQVKSRCFVKMVHQSALNLMGNSNELHVLTGRELDESEVLRHAKEINDEHWLLNMQRYRIQAHFWFAEYDKVVQIMHETRFEYGSFDKIMPGMLYLCFLYFHITLSCISVAKRSKSKKRRYITLAKRFAKKVRGWAKQGDPNVLQHAELLSAELAACHGRKLEATRYYASAILLAGRSGFIHDQALAHERCGEFRLDQNDREDARYHFTAACRLYNEWGAKAKVAHLRKAHEDTFSLPTETKIATQPTESL